MDQRAKLELISIPKRTGSRANVCMVLD